jgi:hypothetical protein
MIDLERLHEIIESKNKGRKHGRTFLSITYLATAVSFREPVIYCILHKFNNVSEIKKLIQDIFKDYELPSIRWYGLINFECYFSKVFFIFVDCPGIIRKELEKIPEDVPIIMMYEDYYGHDFFIKNMNEEQYG